MNEQQTARTRTGRPDTPLSQELHQARRLRDAAEIHLLEVMAARQRLEETAGLVRSLHVSAGHAAPAASVKDDLFNPISTVVGASATMFDNMTEGELDAVAERLLTAYRDAEYRCDERGSGLLRACLLFIGRLIAKRIGPKAAGLQLH